MKDPYPSFAARWVWPAIAMAVVGSGAYLMLAGNAYRLWAMLFG